MSLTVEKLSKNFGGLKVLRDVSLRIGKGEFVGLIGPNGAGKTTLFNTISGIIKPDKGKIVFDNHEISGKSAHSIARMGLRRTFQLAQPFTSMTVLQNVMVSSIFGSSIKLGRDAAEEKARECVRIAGLSDRSDVQSSILPIAQLRSLEIARALAGSPKLLMLDEVLAGLNETEISEKLELLGRLNTGGLTIVMIEHNLRALMSICRKVFVMVDGSIATSGLPEEVMTNEKVIKAYIGSEVTGMT